MKKNRTRLIISLFLVLGISWPLFAQGVILKRDIHIKKSDQQDNVISFGGQIVVEGKVRESVIAFGGKIIISGEVDNAVVGIGAEIILHPTAYIHGDLVSIGGSINRDPQAIIDGDTIFFETSEELWNSIKTALGGLFGLSFIPFILLVKLFSLIVWLIIALLLALLFPRQVVASAQEIRRNFWPVFGIGFLSIIIFAGLIISAALLSLILIGIPLLIILIFLGIALKLFSRVVIYIFFGESLTRALGSRNPALILQVIVGFLFVSIVTFIPLCGSLVAFIFNIMGWGAVIKSRFGTRSTLS
ncbi:MAG TPA: hypothetical protein ENF17_05270 [Candidatus Aminicenantes bacterium]|nr:hypothetical protein [Candidatus Aminicenantes bacterium]